MSENNNIEMEDENFMFGTNKEIPFSIPSFYFDSLSERIIYKIELAEEASEFSLLAGINKQSVFNVPENYFEGIENELEYKIESEALVELNKITKPVLKPLPEEYYNSLKENITNKIELADELRMYATLYAIDKQNSFEVSADYFDNVTDKIKEKIHTKSQTQLSIIEKIMMLVLKPKFGVAFGIVIITGIAGLFYINQQKTIIDSGDCKTLACLEKRDMLNDHTVREMDDDNLLEMVDVDKLDKQIENGNATDSSAIKQNKK